MPSAEISWQSSTTKHMKIKLETFTDQCAQHMVFMWASVLGFLGLLLIKTKVFKPWCFVECKDLNLLVLSLPNRYLFKLLASIHVSCSVCEKCHWCMWRGIQFCCSFELDCVHFDEVWIWQVSYHDVYIINVDFEMYQVIWACRFSICIFTSSMPCLLN